MEEKIRQELYSKMEKELKDYKDSLKSKTPEEIMNNAYQLTLKEEMICNFYPECLIYDIEDIKRLNKKSQPLQELYDDWMDSDMNINQLLEDNINDYFLKLKDEQEKKKNNRER